MIKRKLLIVNLVIFLAVMAGDLFYMEHGGLWRKGLTSFGFVLMGLINVLTCRPERKRERFGFPLVMVLGLFFCMLGDIFINIDFIPGAALFAVGHLFYFTAYCRLQKPKLLDLIPFVLIFAASVLIIKCVPILDFNNGLIEGICLGYALVISLMASKAVANLFRGRKLIHWILVLGCVLFYFSDLMLVFDVFADTPDYIATLCMVSYYPAQCLLAFSISCNYGKE